MEATITRQEVLKQINANAVFDIEFVTCNQHKGTGGALVAYKGCVKHTKQSIPKAKLSQLEVAQKRRSHNHQYHSTINIYRQDLREIKTVHIRLITLFNGKRVI